MTIELDENLSFDDVIVESDHIKYWKNRFNDRKDLIASSIVARVLFEYYIDDREYFYKLQSNDRTRAFPILSRDEWMNSTTDPDDVIASVDPDDWNTDYDQQFIWDICMQKVALELDADTSSRQISVREHMWNDPYYRVDGVQAGEDGSLTINLGMTDYFTYVSNARRIVEEVYDQSQRFNITKDSNADEAAELLKDRLPFRDKIAPSFSVLESGRPYHILSLLVATALETSDGTKIILMNRVNKNVDYPRSIGVAPAGITSPFYDLNQEADLKYLMLREFGEEVLNSHEYKLPPEDPSSNDWILENQVVDDLHTSIEDGESQFDITGFGFNALSGASQLYGLLHITDEEMANKIHEDVKNRDGESEEGDLFFEDIPNTKDKIFTHSSWAPGAAVTVSRAIETIKERRDD